MIEFQVNDMTCGHCAGVITKAVAEVDAAAKVEIDLATHRLFVGYGQPNTPNPGYFQVFDLMGVSGPLTSIGTIPFPIGMHKPSGTAIDPATHRLFAQSSF